MDDYEVLQKLGAGSYGMANLAIKKDSNEKCVIKEINISHMTEKEIIEAKHEVQVLSSLAHPYVTQFRDSFEDSGRLLIIMDYCAGGDLYTLIQGRKGVNFPEDRVLDWFVQLCLAMKYIHDRRILHRDIKSQNVFLTDDGRVKLGDFGISKVLSSTSELARTCIGTPYYLSPEMCESRPYNNKSDIWALGCVLYEMAALKHAFASNNMKNLVLKIVKGSYAPIPAKYSRDLGMLLSQIFQREPRSRPSMSVILRKPFIFKRIPRFITGCEEEELLNSLKKRKCPVPTKRIIPKPQQRPRDVTDPAAKYGVSQSTSKRRSLGNKQSKSSLPGASNKVIKQSRESIPEEIKKQRRVVGKEGPNKKIDALKKSHREKYPSENNLLNPNWIKGAVEPREKETEFRRSEREADHRRSISVPRTFKNAQSKSKNSNIKNPSPEKLDLMLESAGYKQAYKSNNRKSMGSNESLFSKKNIQKISRQKRRQSMPSTPPKKRLSLQNSSPPPSNLNIHNAAQNHLESPQGWLVDEFLSRKLRMAQNERRVVESFSAQDSKGSTNQSNKNVNKVLHKIQKGQYVTAKQRNSLPTSEILESNYSPTTKSGKAQNSPSNSNSSTPNNSPYSKVPSTLIPKETKDLVNKSLQKEIELSNYNQNKHTHENVPEDSSSSDGSNSDLRQAVQSKMHSAVQAGAKRMNFMVEKRRNAAYQQEKENLKTVVRNDSKNISSQMSHPKNETLTNPVCKADILNHDFLCNSSIKKENPNVFGQEIHTHKSDMKFKNTGRESDVGFYDVTKDRDEICMTNLSTVTTISDNATASYCEINEQSTVCMEDIDSQACTSTPSKQIGRALWKSNSQEGKDSPVIIMETKWQVFNGGGGIKSLNCPLCTVCSTDVSSNTPHICHHIGCSTPTEVPICSRHDIPLVNSGTLSPSGRACWGSSPGPRLPKSAIKVPELPGPISPSVHDKVSASQPSWCHTSNFIEIPPSDSKKQVLEQSKAVIKRAQWGKAKSNSEPSQIHKLPFTTKTPEEINCKSPDISSGIVVNWAQIIASSTTSITEDEIIVKVNETEKSPDKYPIEPIRRARWGSIKSAGLENSPLELTASKMEVTSALDLVSVFKERKQWGKEQSDIVNVLSDKILLERTLSQNVQFRKGKPIVTKKSNEKPSVLRKNIGTAAFARKIDTKQAMKKSKSEIVVYKPSHMENDSKPSVSTFTKESKIEMSNATYKIKKDLVPYNDEMNKGTYTKSTPILLKAELTHGTYTKKEASDIKDHVDSKFDINNACTDVSNLNAYDSILSMNTTFVVDSSIDIGNESLGLVETNATPPETMKVHEECSISLNIDLLDKVDQSILQLLVESPEKSEMTEHKEICISEIDLAVEETENKIPEVLSSPCSDENIESSQVPNTPEVSGNVRKKSQGGILSMLRSRFNPNKNKQVVNKLSSTSSATNVSLNEENSSPKQSTKIKSGIVGALRKLTSKSGDTQAIFSKQTGSSEASSPTSESCEEPESKTQTNEKEILQLKNENISSDQFCSNKPNTVQYSVYKNVENSKILKKNTNEDPSSQSPKGSNTTKPSSDDVDKEICTNIKDENLESLKVDTTLSNISSNNLDIKSSGYLSISNLEVVDPLRAELSIDGCAISDLLSRCEGTITKNDLLARTETRDEILALTGKSDDSKESKSLRKVISDSKNKNILVKENKEQDVSEKPILIMEKEVLESEMQRIECNDSSDKSYELELKENNNKLSEEKEKDEHLSISSQEKSQKDFENSFTVILNKMEIFHTPLSTKPESTGINASDNSTVFDKISFEGDEIESEINSEFGTVSDSETGELGDAEQSDEERSESEERFKAKCNKKNKNVNKKLSTYQKSKHNSESLLEGSSTIISADDLQETLVTSFQDTHLTFKSFKNTQATEEYFSLDSTQTTVSDVPESRAYLSLLENTMQPYLSSLENTQSTLQGSQNSISILRNTKATLESLQNTHSSTFASFQSTTLGPLQSTASTLEPLQSSLSINEPQHSETSNCIGTFLNESHMASSRSLNVSSDSGFDTHSVLDTHGTHCLSNLSQITENSVEEIKEIKRGFDTEDHDSGKEVTPETSPVKPDDEEYNKIKESSSDILAKNIYSTATENVCENRMPNKENFLSSALSVSSVPDTFMTASENTIAIFSNEKKESPENLTGTVIKNSIRNPLVTETNSSVMTPITVLARSGKLPDITFELTSELPFLESPRAQYQRCRLEKAMDDAKKLAQQVVKEAMEKAQMRMIGCQDNFSDDNALYRHLVNLEETRKSNGELSCDENKNPSNVEEWRDACSTFTEANDSVSSSMMQDDTSNICSGEVIRRRVQPPTTLDLSCILEPRRRSNSSCWDVSPLDKDIMASSESPGGVPSGISSEDSDSDNDRDLTSLRESMENILNEEASGMSCFPPSEVWHLDEDGSVVDGVGGDIYGWIEEQKARLEDLVGLDTFMKVYHCLECAQEKEGCVLGAAVREAESILGPTHTHLASDVLQLVMAEAVYHR